MVKQSMLTGLLCLGTFGLWAQNPSMEAVLQHIATNNTELKALRSQQAAQQEARQAEQSLAGPSVGGYYMPWGEHDTGDYWEVEATQTFAFPTVYGAQRDTRAAQAVADGQAYAVRRQEILREAQDLCLSLIHGEKQRLLSEKRLEQARKVLAHTEGQLAAETVNKVAVHKARLALLEAEMDAEDWRHQRRELLLELVGLNGGQSLSWEATEYGQPLDSLDHTVLWERWQAEDPTLQAARSRRQVAELQATLARQTKLPNFTVGANYQGVPSSGYAGIYAGISLPLWGSTGAVAAAQTQAAAQGMRLRALEEQTQARFDQQWGHYHHKLAQYRTYRETLRALDSESYLHQAYTLGEMPYTEYAAELAYYREAQNTLLQLEYDLQKSQAQLLSIDL